jgi:trimethylamine:corrinoid methyltransferase-like protein
MSKKLKMPEKMLKEIEKSTKAYSKKCRNMKKQVKIAGKTENYIVISGSSCAEPPPGKSGREARYFFALISFC